MGASTSAGPCSGVPLNNQPYDRPNIKGSLLGEQDMEKGLEVEKGGRQKRTEREERGREEEAGWEHVGK